MDEGEVDFAYALTGIGRFRVNVFRQRGSIVDGAARDPARDPAVRASSRCPAVVREPRRGGARHGAA